jgi:hypothetical protein
MISFDRAVYRIVQYRICLERDARRGIIAGSVAGQLDRCFRDLGDRLEFARVELEGAGLGRRRRLAGAFVTACAELARSLFLAIYREPDSRKLIARSESLDAEAVQLTNRLKARLHRAA